MSAYLRSWFGASSLTNSASPQPPNTTPEQSRKQESESELSLEVYEPDEQQDDDSGAESDRTETDASSAFPALNSAQRLVSSLNKMNGTTNASIGSALPKVLTERSLMPPPPSPGNASRVPGAPTPLSSNTGPLALPPSGLMPPPSNFGLSVGGPVVNGGGTLGVPTTRVNIVKSSGKKAREKVALAPGFGPLDWAALKSSGVDLRSVDTLLRVTPSMLKQHSKKDDAWAAFYGKVYNISPYLPYHPGGEKELMRVAGRDGTKLFVSTHAWVNVEFMLDACLVGFLVSETYGS